MTTTKRQQILDALKTRLETILVASGYLTDAGKNVRYWDDTPMDNAAEAMRIEFRDEGGSVGYEAVQEHWHRLPVTVRISVLDNETQDDISLAVRNISDICADIYQAIHTDVTFGSLANDANQDGEMTLEYDEKGDRATGAVVRWIIEFTTAPGNPYA